MNTQRLTVADLDSHLRWKQAPLPAEACTDIGADSIKRGPAQWRVLLAICIGSWLAPVLLSSVLAWVSR